MGEALQVEGIMLVEMENYDLVGQISQEEEEEKKKHRGKHRDGTRFCADDGFKGKQGRAIIRTLHSTFK